MSNIPTLRFKEFSEDWEEKTLKSISELISYGLTVRPEYIKSGIPLISARELKGGKINYDMAPKISENSYNILSSKAKAYKGDIFLTKTGTIGLSAYVDVDFPIAITQNISVIRVDEKLYNHQFILQIFKTKRFNKHIMQKVNQSTIMDLQLQDIRKSLIYLPQKKE
ncbi:restriction endonuclease subunit S [Arcobacteraceae bacterium]|nr:restriction endonuclease subunit S [Arcobacteraceae bacterium]